MGRGGGDRPSNAVPGGAKSGFAPPIISENRLKRGTFGGAEGAAENFVGNLDDLAPPIISNMSACGWGSRCFYDPDFFEKSPFFGFFGNNFLAAHFL